MKNGSKLLVFAIVVFCVAARPDWLNNKIVVGYQGWFQTTEGSWRHWSLDGRSPRPNDLAFDVWPDTSEYDASLMAETDLVMKSGDRAKLFSCSHRSTVDLHFRWMQEYGIDGAFLQRFVHETRIDEMLAFRNLVLGHVAFAAEKYNRSFVVMWDTSGTPCESYFDWIKDDYERIASMGVFENQAYQRHNGKPVVVVWGFGFSDRPGNLEIELRTIEFLKGKGLTVIGGTPFFWRLGKEDSKPGWKKVYDAFDMISPWAVGRWTSEAGYNTLFSDVVKGDFQQLAGKQDYAPVVSNLFFTSMPPLTG